MVFENIWTQHYMFNRNKAVEGKGCRETDRSLFKRIYYQDIQKIIKQAQQLSEIHLRNDFLYMSWGNKTSHPDCGRLLVAYLIPIHPLLLRKRTCKVQQDTKLSEKGQRPQPPFQLAVHLTKFHPMQSEQKYWIVLSKYSWHMPP